MLEMAIGIGITVNLLLTELLGVASAGLVVPGYLALDPRAARQEPARNRGARGPHLGDS